MSSRSSLSPKRIAKLVALIGGLLLVVLLAGPAVGVWDELTEPVLVLPEIEGTATLHGQPLAGLEVRRSMITAKGREWPSCEHLPVVAVSDAVGRFQVSATYRPSLLANVGGFTYETCYMYNGSVVTKLVGFADFNEFGLIRIRCELPGTGTGHFEDMPCSFSDAKYAHQRTVHRGW